MNMNLNKTLAEAAEHIAFVRSIENDDVPVIDEYVKRFVRTFYPEHYEVLFKNR